MPQLAPMSLMILAIFFLVLPGMLYNNLNNNNLAVAQTQSLSCSADIQTPTCQISGNVGCQAASANCNLSGSSISFVSHNSIFTRMFTDPVGLVLSPFGTNGFVSHGPFDLFGGGPYTRVNCFVTGNTGLSLTKIAMANGGTCTEVNNDNSNKTAAVTSATRWTQYNTNWRGTSKTAYIVSLPNVTLGQVMNFLAQINYTSPGGTTGYTYYGQDFFSGGGCCADSNIGTQDIWGVIYSVPYENGALPSGNSHQYFYAQLVPFSGFECYLSNVGQSSTIDRFRSQQCSEFVKNVKIGASASCTQGANSVTCSSSGGGTSSVLGYLTPLLVFIVGIVLLLVGLGLNFTFGGNILGTGTTFAAGSNEQGTRMAQTLGLGLVIWAPLYSEFSPWFTSGRLPYGFDGTLGIMAFILTGLFFIGVFWRALSRN